MSLLTDFKEFALRGNVVDMAVGVIIGTAFGKIVSSIVDDLIMLPIGRLTGHIDFHNVVIPWEGTPIIRIGSFIQNVVNFVIIAACVFAMVRLMNAVIKSPPAEPTSKDCPFCFSKIPIRATRCPNCTSQLPA
jgi:large conductance mechanosensitive channel